MSLKYRLCAAAAALFLFSAAGAETVSAETPAVLSADEVFQVEQRLQSLGYLAGTADQSFDAETRQALESFQQANDLTVTGQPDEATLAALNGDSALSRQEYLQRFIKSYRDMTPLQSGDISSQVQAMQRLLTEYGYFTGNSDGVFGEATQKAVERFQMVNGLQATGVADGMTLMRLMAPMPVTWQVFLSEMNCAPGDVGLNVYVLQNKLSAMGYYEGECTGSFGEYTQRAVTRFQAENGLDATGVADTAMWDLIYSGSAVALRRSDVIQIGDAGESVMQVQERLYALGYTGFEPDGRFDYATETALRLFQMAHELNATGRAGSDTMNALMSDAAKPADDPGVVDRFATMLSDRSPDIQAAVYDIAARMVGTAFDIADDALYPGFGFAQYVCVAAGLPVTGPEDLIRLADTPVQSASEVAAGNIVAFQTADSDSVSMLLTVGGGESRVIYATHSVGWVVVSYMSQINSASAYRWSES